jgi:heptaprenyl diphosphate synthase
MTLLHSRYHQELKNWMDQVESKAFHPYVLEYVSYPRIRVFQLHFTYLFLLSRECPKDLIESICISQMFIQLGLDSHEEVGLDVLSDGSMIKNRQLTVLSGDYFSSHYYLFLAEKNHPELIQKWATVIKEINECKADLHAEAEFLTQEELWQKKHDIQRKLTSSVISWFEPSSTWLELFSLFIQFGMDEANQFYEMNEVKINKGAIFHRIKWLIESMADGTTLSELKIWFNPMLHEQLVSDPG